VERPFIPAELVLGARGTFFARTLDVDMPTTVDCMIQAAQHQGASVIECLVNCVIFNHGTHNWIADRDTRADRSIVLRHGEKMIFGKDNDKGLALDYSQGLIPQLIVVPADDERVLTHDATTPDPTLHRMLAMMGQDEASPKSSPKGKDFNSEEELPSLQGGVGVGLPIALGVIRRAEAESYDAAVNQQIEEVRAKSKAHTFDQLTKTLEQWEIK
jgi:2-oxoglutarate ferredoxin oxidoreductase subunit beta